MQVAIKGMTCGHCVKAVRRALESLPNATAIDVSLENGKATLEGAEPSAVLAAIRDEGYEAELVT